MKKLVPGLALAVVAGATAVLPAVALAPPAIAAPGNPGTPSDPQVLFHEDFENDMADGQVKVLGDYVGADGETYGAEGAWADPTMSNGFVLDGTTSDADQAALGSPAGAAQLRNLATGLGGHNGTQPPEANHAVAAFTAGDPGANKVELRTAAPLALDVENKFLTFSVNVGVVNCHAAHPLLRFYLDDGNAEIPVSASAADPCPNGSRTVSSDGSVLFTGSSLGIVLRNEQASGSGNDHAFDDIRVLDATPQLDKSFGTEGAPAGFPTTLTFTVTNTSELASKNGWSFTDNLPTGMEIAPDPRFTTDCGNGAITGGGTPGATSVALEGDLATGQAACTLSIDVVTPEAEAGDTFTNAAANVDDLVGLNPPGSAQLTVTERGLPKVSCAPAAARATQRWWHFGNGAGLDFGTSGSALPVTTPSTGVNAVEGTTVITDSAGKLLFWSDGVKVLDKNHQVMPNGAGLTGNASATQTVAAFPSLTDPGKYFVVATTGASEVGGSGHLSYSVVDMSLNGGLGDVTATKNVDLAPANGAAEQLTAIPNAAGTGFWVVTAQASSPNIRAYSFDGAGPADPDGAGPLAAGDSVISVMPTPNYNQYGTLNLSPDLSSVLLATGNNAGASRIRLMDFDASTGRFAQRFEWSTPTGAGGNMYSADFSPSGDHVYATRIFGGAHLFRYDIAGAADGAAVKATEVDLGQYHANGGQVKRGPDGRMYVVNRGAATLGVIASPDAADPAEIGFDATALPLTAGTINGWGLPQMVTGCPTTPGIELTKTAELTTDHGTAGKADAGDVITYTFVVHNSGYVPVEDVTVEDALPGLSPVTPASVATLPAGEDAEFTATYTVTQADVDAGGQVVNTATAKGTDPDGGEVTSPEGPGTTAKVDISDAEADLDIVKSAELTTDVAPKGKADDGDVLTYTFTVTNHGKATAHDVSVTDALPGLSAVAPASVATIAPGGQAAFTATYTITHDDVVRGGVENTASVTYQGPTRGGQVPTPVTEQSNTLTTATGPLGAPVLATRADKNVAMKVAKGGKPAAVKLSDEITLTGFLPGGDATGTATLYGPFTDRASIACVPAKRAGSVTFAPRSGTFRSPAVSVSKPGYYTWVVATSEDRRNSAATHACGLAAETTLVHRAEVGKLEIETGFTGMDPSAFGRQARPTQVAIPAIGMKAKVDVVGTRRGSMVIPNDVRKGGWLMGSAAPGEAIGSTVIAGHVSDRHDRPGAFGKLNRAKVGQVVTVRGADGKVQRYRIAKVYTQKRTKGFAGAPVSTTGAHQLTLVTCTGKVRYSNGRFHYTKNQVVIAAPIG
ncbi:sortase domain-bontaining protein [Pimelobacter simplex]|uniref:DUF7507 domain-containing protein n=1 Tax=Nocardioides simplex TaxID=2045 RepID=UPI00381389A7